MILFYKSKWENIEREYGGDQNKRERKREREREILFYKSNWENIKREYDGDQNEREREREREVIDQIILLSQQITSNL